MKTKAESKSILDDWVVSKIDYSIEDPNFGFIETFYQTCSAALGSLWKSQFRAINPGPHKSTLKKDIASIRLWEENFPPGHLDTILAESSGLKIAVLESLIGIGKILVPYFRVGDGDEDVFDIRNESAPERNFAKELKTQLEKAALMFDPDETSDSSSDDETSDDSSSSTERHHNHLGRIHSYISCLIDLIPAVERYIYSLQCKAEAQSVPIKTVFRLSHRAQPYAMLISDRFTNAPSSLVKRLAEANLERSIRLRTHEDDEEEVNEESHREAMTLFKPFSLFHDSGLGTSIPAISQYAATVASHTSFLSVGGEEALGRPRVPTLPQEGGAPFQCGYCHRTISMRNRIQWKMHVFADLQSYICTHESCKDALKTFPTRKLWADHEFNEHFALLQWRCFTCTVVSSTPDHFAQHLVQAHGIQLTGNRLAAAISEARESILTTDFKDYKCSLCSHNGWQSRNSYATHVGRHLEEISLACLPRAGRDSSEDDTTDRSSASDNINEPTFSNGEDIDFDVLSLGFIRTQEPIPSIPEPIPADWGRNVIVGTLNMTSLENTSTQDRKSILFSSSSISNQQSAGSQSTRPSSYWSVAERHDFKMLLAQFGKDFEAISEFMKTKTPVMVRNYYNRRLDAGEIELENVARDAEIRKARVESPHLLTISNAASMPDYQMEQFRLRQQKRDQRENKRLSLQQQAQMPNADPFHQSETKSETQQPGLDYEQEIRPIDRYLRDDHKYLWPRIPPLSSMTVSDSFPDTRDDSGIYSAERDPFVYSAEGDLEGLIGPPSPTLLPPRHLPGLETFQPLASEYQKFESIAESRSHLHGRSKSEEYVPPASDENVPSRRRKEVTSQTPYQKAGATNEPNANQSSPMPHITSESRLKPARKKKFYYRCRCANCSFLSQNKATFKRHVQTMHYPQYEYSCHFDDCLPRFHRIDKLKSHYSSVHRTHLSQEKIANSRIVIPVPVLCPLCLRAVQDWPDFYGCFVNHCEAIECDEVEGEGDDGQIAAWSRATV
ncbi:hypothetical protein PEBR_11720 [Penicillium brasilianum]|uniref:C2H2-type domain-containing protein n=1 Tax=Penicillium brasilianum TaxID=104259 RepID=A0A1S9RTM5_PENBI|nr:hypothetical protein PEBR_11720 [Penicillium brasilianum]